jgi:hypothetical protein
MHKENIKHLVLIGASHLKRTIPHLQRLGYEITDVTSPGRVISVAVVEQVRDQLKGTSIPAAAVVVLDLFGNSSFRWEEEDGTPVMPVRDGGVIPNEGPGQCVLG